VVKRREVGAMARLPTWYPGRIREAARRCGLPEEELGGDIAVIKNWLSSPRNDPNTRDHTGATLMHHALHGPSLAAVRLLLAHGADPNLPPKTLHGSTTAIHYAAEELRIDIMVALIDHGARLDVVDNHGHQPLMTCARAGRYKPLRTQAVRLLLSRGAPLLAEDVDGLTAEQYTEWNSEQQGGGDDAGDLLRDVRLADGWKRYTNVPRKGLLILRELCNRGRAVPPRELAALFCTSVDNTRSRTRKGRRLLPLPTAVFWHVVSFWRSERDAISRDAIAAVGEREFWM
tara:strand:+ start:221 stop:1084 length:864 start_codon:yes stop_codon:yes gene_type:complete